MIKKIIKIISPRNSLLEKIKSRQQPASLTVETAFVFPLFFIFFFMIWQTFSLILFELSFEKKFTETVISVQSIGYSYRQVKKEDVTYAGLIFIPEIVAGFDRNEYVRNYRVSRKYEDDGTLLISVEYDYVIGGFIFENIEVPVKQSFSVRAFLGTYDKKKSEGTVDNEEPVDGTKVYVTQNGTVYHLSPVCTYILRVAKAVPKEKISSVRNAHGQKYTECEKCAGNKSGTEVYVTEYGTKYHCDAECSSLKKNIEEKDISEVAGMRPCTKCAKE